MKLLICVAAILSVALAENLKPIHLTPPLLIRNSRLPSSFNPRIVGGEEVVPNSIPWQVGLLISTADGTGFCGGSLISQTTILTAAHCAELSNDIEIRLGAHRINDNEATQVRVQASRIIIHPQWNRLTLQNDIALLVVASPIQLNANIGVVRLPSRGSGDYNGNLATVSGWGLPSDSATSISEVLRSITIPVGTNSVCNWYYLGVIQDSHLCASGENGRSTCSGDSGGPLVASTGEQIGIVSFGISFGCEAGWPHVYTRVTSFLDWIEQNSDVVLY